MSSFSLQRTEARKSQYKKTIDAEDARRKRSDLTVQIRKSKRDDELLKRRKEIGTLSAEETAKQQQEIVALQANKSAVMASLIEGVKSADPAAQLQAVERIRRMLSVDRNPPIQEVIDCQLVPVLVRFLTYAHHPKLQYEAAWALTNILSGNTEQTMVVLNAGAVPLFMQLASSPNEELREQALWAIGNITGESPELRDYMINAGAIDTVLQCLNYENLEDVPITTLRVGTWAISNFCRGKPSPQFSKVKKVLPTLARLIQLQDEDLLVDACWALSYLSDGDESERIQAVLEAGVVRRVVNLLLHKNITVQTPALRTVGNLLTGDDLQTQTVINVGVLPNLGVLLESTKKSIKKEACWAISNITAGNKQQIQSAIDSGVIEPLIGVMKTAEFDVRREAAWAISNCTSALVPEQIRYIVRKGAIEGFVDLLDYDDVKLVLICLEGLQNILKVGQMEARKSGGRNLYADKIEECGGVDKLENLQHHNSQQVYKVAMELIVKYWNGEEDQNVAPNANANTYTFGMQSQPGQTFNFHQMTGFVSN